LASRGTRGDTDAGVGPRRASPFASPPQRHAIPTSRAYARPAGRSIGPPTSASAATCSAHRCPRRSPARTAASIRRG